MPRLLSNAFPAPVTIRVYRQTGLQLDYYKQVLIHYLHEETEENY
jgi:hypothetical protein